MSQTSEHIYTRLGALRSWCEAQPPSPVIGVIGHLVYLADGRVRQEAYVSPLGNFRSAQWEMPVEGTPAAAAFSEAFPAPEVRP